MAKDFSYATDEEKDERHKATRKEWMKSVSDQANAEKAFNAANKKWKKVVADGATDSARGKAAQKEINKTRKALISAKARQTRLGIGTERQAGLANKKHKETKRTRAAERGKFGLTSAIADRTITTRRVKGGLGPGQKSVRTIKGSIKTVGAAKKRAAKAAKKKRG
tara:strand:+ start:1038 stop:1535 length:498 start_codon:yes stop_codon:yes gene_type:complete